MHSRLATNACAHRLYSRTGRLARILARCVYELYRTPPRHQNPLAHRSVAESCVGRVQERSASGRAYECVEELDGERPTETFNPKPKTL